MIACALERDRALDVERRAPEQAEAQR
jgi:hypothetical protein